MLSSEFEWNVEQYERFTFMAAEFDVQAAKKLIVATPREVQNGSIKNMRGFLEWIRVDKERLAATTKEDLKIPLIVARVTDPDTGEFSSVLPINGYSRMRKALQLGIETLPFVMLTEEETLAIRTR